MNSKEPIDSYPLSPMQQGMLLHYLKEPSAGNDVEQMVCTLREEIDAALLRQAWERVVERHPVLRTAFRYEDGDDMKQVVYSEMPLSWEEQDWREVPKDQRERQLRAFLTSDRHRAFNLTEGPLLRLTFAHTFENEYQLIWTFHHILMDGRSFPLILNEVFAFYEAIREGRELHLDSPRPYRDYIDWLQCQDIKRGEAYWREQLAGFAAPTRLTAESAITSGTEPTDRQGDDSVFLSSVSTSALTDFAHDHGLTLNTLVQGAWALLLGHYSGEDDVLYGVVRACRKSSIHGADDMIGLFINTLPLRVHITPELTVLEWLKQLRAHWTSMRDHEHTPLAQVQKWCAVPSGTSLFESILMFESYQLDKRLRDQGEKWANRSFRLHEQTGYPLTLTVYSGTELCLQIEFDRSRFDADVIHRMLSHLRSLLEGMRTCARRRLRELPMLTPEEVRQLTVVWNDTQRDYPRHVGVHQLFEQQVKQSPDSVAVICEGQKLTYRELNARANQLAHLLRRRGAKPDKLVALCIDRSVGMVVAVLAILKAGSAYVPLDPAFPKERLALILEDSQANILVTQRGLASSLPDFQGSVVYMDDPELSTCEEDEPVTGVESTNLAYVIFTSGSTGRPKGVQIEHRSVVNFLTSMKQEPGLTADDTLVAVTTLSFDIAGLELFLPLTVGACVVVVSRDVAMDGRRLAQLLDQSNATIMQATPATWRVLLESGWLGRKCMKIVCGGEAMQSELAKDLLPRCSSLWNVYGPTETTIWSTVWQVTSTEAPIPIGKPIANTQVFVLDRHLHPVPVGVIGELYIGGEGLARGYLNRPELTAERFVLNPYSDESAARVYKTGDLCRWRSDGSIECLGRNDHQVKIRGYRIELEDIETALSSHPDVRQAVVNVQERSAGERRLVAYVVAENGVAPHSEELRKHLTSYLPEYMVPTAYMVLTALPLTPNGKVDRKALPRVVEVQSDPATPWSPPESEAERIIAKVWEELLDVTRVSNNSNFFDLGGDSLLMIRVRSKLEHAFHRELKIIELFRHPTVRSLANYMCGQEAPIIVHSRSRKDIAANKESARRRLQLRRSRIS